MHTALTNPTDAATDAILSLAFAALADPTRRAILARLALGETSVGNLIKPFPISGPAISRHLRILENARLIERKVDAQWRICRLHPPGLRVADDWLSQYRAYWEQGLDRLASVLERGEGHPPALPCAAAATPRVARNQQDACNQKKEITMNVPKNSRLSSAVSSARRAKRSTTPSPQKPD